jgi:hypothetical protein
MRRLQLHKGDFSLRRLTFLQEQKGKKKSAGSVRNDGMPDAGE